MTPPGKPPRGTDVVAGAHELLEPPAEDTLVLTVAPGLDLGLSGSHLEHLPLLYLFGPEGQGCDSRRGGRSSALGAGPVAERDREADPLAVAKDGQGDAVARLVEKRSSTMRIRFPSKATPARTRTTLRGSGEQVRHRALEPGRPERVDTAFAGRSSESGTEIPRVPVCDEDSVAATLFLTALHVISDPCGQDEIRPGALPEAPAAV